MERYLREKIYENEEDIRKNIDEFFTSEEASFYHRGIEQLPGRWQKVIGSNGMYFDFWWFVIWFLYRNFEAKKNDITYATT